MSMEKSQIKVSTANEIGVKIDDALEHAQASVHAAKGAKEALEVAAQRIEGHQKTIDKDLEDGVIALELHGRLKRAVTQCVHIVRSLGIAADDEMLRLQGKVLGLKAAIGVCKAVMDTEEAKIKAVAAAMKRGDVVSESSGQIPGPGPGDAPVIPIRPAGGPPPPRAEGTHPGPSLADQRKAAEAAEAAKADAADPPHDVMPMEPAKPADPRDPPHEEPAKTELPKAPFSPAAIKPPPLVATTDTSKTKSKRPKKRK